MGLFSKRRTAADPQGWHLDGTGVQGYLDSDELGDIHSGYSYSLRLVNPTLPGRFTTISYFPVQYPAWGSHEWGVLRQVKWSIPDLELAWADSGLVNETALNSSAEAEAYAVQFANEDAEDPSEYAGWDGEPINDAEEI